VSIGLTWGALEVQTAIADHLTTGSPTPNIAWDGYGGPTFTPPALDPADPEASLWIRPSHIYREQAVMYGGGWHISIGRGQLAIQVFGAPGLTTGPDEVTPAAATTIADLFRGEAIDGIEFETCEQTQVNDPDSNWNMIVLNLSFTTNLRRPA
jgi:hypothetical protein